MEPLATRPPTGTVTFLFSDIEGSTIRWDAHRAEMRDAVRRHDDLMRVAIERHGGYVFKTIGDAFCAAFSVVDEGIAAALEAQRDIAAEDWGAVRGLRVRIAIHVGTADERDADYFGPTVNRVARLLAIGHGGQVLLSGAAVQAIDVLPSQATLLDLGRHRLKDLTDPEQVYQLCAPDLDAEFRPLNSLDVLRHNLPEQLTPLIGRDEELAEIKTRLEQSRLVTLTGSGGVGKTRVALQLAADLMHDYGDGVWFVDLSALDDPILVPGEIAAVFDVTDGSAQPLIERLAIKLKKKRLLIVLDNCEQVIAAVADAADGLLRVCPGIRILATSREPLGISGEKAYRMPSLAIPAEDEDATAERALQYPAVELFVARAHAAAHTFVLTDQNAGIVARIVRRLDGIAMAIELAAPCVKVLSLKQLDQRLDERFKLLTGGSRRGPSRQQTLRALIGWSYDLLTEAQRSLLRQSAIFRGGWTLEAAEAICMGERFPDWNVLDLLASLVDKSLVVVESEGPEQRYRLLESTRQFAQERLAEAGEREAVAARHGVYFAEVAQRAGEAYWQSDGDEWSARARRDLENARAAIGWALSNAHGRDEDAVAAATIVGGLRYLWNGAARREGRMLVERVLAALSDAASVAARGQLALAQALLDEGSANGLAAAAEAVRLLEGGDALSRAEALRRQGQALGRAGRLAEAVAIFEEGLTVARATRAPRLIAYVLTSAAYWIGAAGDRARARAQFDEAAALLRACHDPRRLAAVQLNRAELLFAEGDPAGALVARARPKPPIASAARKVT
jgi:predicted ATPase/class 3 adenylate cyclase